MKGITFSGEMVRAILEGRKTMTRRIVKPQPVGKLFTNGTISQPVIEKDGHYYACNHEDESSHDTPYNLMKSPYKPGDRLWVKEGNPNPAYDGCRWRSSRFMPRWASRITIEVVSVRVERLQDISPEDCIREGLPINPVHIRPGCRYATENAVAVAERFRELWNKLYRKEPEKQWNANPWVWVVEFKVVTA